MGLTRRLRSTRPARAPACSRTLHEDLAVDQGVFVTGRLLNIAAGTGREVIHEGRRRQVQLVVINDVQIGIRARANHSPVLNPEQLAGSAVSFRMACSTVKCPALLNPVS